MKNIDVYAYARLSKEKKQELLRNEALLVETEQENGNSLFLYYVCGFFVEVTYRDGEEIENIPYKRGFSLSNVYEQAA